MVARGQLDATAASSSVSGAELRGAGTTAVDVLGRVPGVQVSRTGSPSDLATAAIRGATSAQTPVYLAGVRLNDDLTGSADLSTLPLFLVQRVEVYRGNSPVEADRLGIGGAVMFEPYLPAGNQLGFGLSAGSFRQRAAFVTAGAGNTRAATVLALQHEGAANDYPFVGPDRRERRRQNSDFRASTLWNVSRLRLSNGLRLTTIVHGYEREQGTPGLALIPDDRARAQTRRLLAAVKADVPCASGPDGLARCRVQLLTTALTTSTSLTDPLREVLPASAAHTRGERIEADARLHVRASKRLSLSANAALAREHTTAGYLGDPPLDARRLSFRPALLGVYTASDRAEISAVASVEHHETRVPVGEQRASSSQPSGRLGVKATLASWLEARANLGAYGRAPSLGELYGLSPSVNGNRALRAERGDTLDAGVHVGARSAQLRFEADLFGFLRRAHDLIAYRQSGPASISPYNVGSARIVGLEAALALAALQHVRATLSTTLMEPRDVTPNRAEQNDILPYRSRLVAIGTAEIFTEDGLSRFGIGRVSLLSRLTHRASKYADSAGLRVIAEQTTVDFELSSALLKSSLALRFALRNAFDRREFDAIGLPLPGRSAYVSVEGRIR